MNYISTSKNGNGLIITLMDGNHRDTETQKHRETELERHREVETERSRQRDRARETYWHRDRAREIYWHRDRECVIVQQQHQITNSNCMRHGYESSAQEIVTKWRRTNYTHIYQ